MVLLLLLHTISISSIFIGCTLLIICMLQNILKKCLGYINNCLNTSDSEVSRISTCSNTCIDKKLLTTVGVGAPKKGGLEVSESEQCSKPWLVVCIEDYTTHLHGNCNKPI